VLNPVTDSGFPVGCWLTVAALLGGLAVAAGAFGAHALEGKVSSHYLDVYQTAVQYQTYHALALLAVALLGAVLPDANWLQPSAWAFLVGIILFSGSLYALVFSGIRILGVITPLAASLFIIGWVLLAVAGFQLRQGS